MEVLFEIIFFVVVVAVLLYAISLHRQLSSLKLGRDDLKLLMRSFNDSVELASKAIQNLKTTAVESEATFSQKIKDANVIYDELEFLVRRSETLVTQLDSFVKQGDRVPFYHGGEEMFSQKIPYGSTGTPQESSSKMDPSLGTNHVEYFKKLQNLR